MINIFPNMNAAQKVYADATGVAMPAGENTLRVFLSTTEGNFTIETTFNV